MKPLLLSLFSLLIIVNVSAQDRPRRVGFRTIGRDSINLLLNDDYQMIEDSCATIIRQGHYDVKNRIFTGHFKDVSRQDPQIILSEGNYTAEGIKDGEFVSHYLNGNLRSKGHFKDDKYDGKWEIYYENGKPKMTFEVNNGATTITDVWNDKGVKTVDNGKGSYKVDIGGLIWSGKLDNGKPDGTWKAVRSGDATEATFVKETFKKGQFQKGENPGMSYTNASRIVFFDPGMLPYITAEKMSVSPVACGGTAPLHIVNAQYREGTAAYSEEMGRLVGAYLRTISLAGYNDQLVIEGLISTTGNIYKLIATTSFNENVAQGIISQLRRLPALSPATANGKPVEEKIIISFKFSLGLYSFSWRLSPVTHQ